MFTTQRVVDRVCAGRKHDDSADFSPIKVQCSVSGKCAVYENVIYTHWGKKAFMHCSPTNIMYLVDV